MLILYTILITFGIYLTYALTPEVIGIYDCDVPKEGIPKGFNMETEFMNGVLNGKLELPFIVDDTIIFKLELKEYVNNTWKHIDTKISGSFCEVLLIQIPTIWTKLTKTLGLNDTCPYQPGNYTLEDFSATPEEVDYNFTSAFHQLFIFNFVKDGVPFLCKQVELKVE